jgi:hypothetical protein
MKLSNWEIQRAKSAYHFDPKVIDPRWDTVIGIGRVVGDYKEEIEQALETAKAVTWRDRASTGLPNALVEAEEYDLVQAGAEADLKIANFEYNLTPKFKAICDMIGLENREDRVHVQWTGQVFSLHIDKLEKFNPEDPSKVMRIMINLTDWEPGHFMQYGNFNHTRWRIGDIYTFDWRHVPHSSANASLKPRVSLLTTGVVGAKTTEFLNLARSQREIVL